MGMERANIKIDAAKLLRLLLEFYRREKRIWSLILKKLWSDQPKSVESSSKQHCLSFESFRETLLNFNQDLTEIDVSLFNFRLDDTIEKLGS